MSRARFFLTQELGAISPARLPLCAEDEHHATRVLRVEPGEELDVVAPSGEAFRVEVVGLSEAGVVARVVASLEPSWYPRVTLFQGVAKGEKMDSIVRQAVEVGAAGIVPVFTSRSIVRLDERKRAERGSRWRRIAESASKQSRRECVVGVADPVGFSAAVELLGTYDRVLVLWEDHMGDLLSDAARSAFADSEASVAVVVGPEGGLSAEEVSALSATGAVVASLGPSIMRTETAAVVSIALVIAAALGVKAACER
ncbi:MAG: RNA methyltransferase [Actinobacteria bacterium HGW-Actinobacteria-7]|jgi:16S rRNA (uracil1498-N3)-methyltransferase|nr:MAG: RNA methyltransferase [Actinobacteria bacterium HGW-Actinobacteria-7]